MGRRVWLPFGSDPLYPNLYVVLVGTPGSRKSTAMKVVVRLMRDGTGIRFAPKDTAGQRQGLILSIEGEHAMDEELNDQLGQDQKLVDLTLDQLGSLTLSSVADPRDRHTMFVAATELTGFIGQNSSGMLEFLCQMYDGEDYDYRISQGGKGRSHLLKEPLLSLIGCTTSASIAKNMPAEASGQGFLSRVILVHGSKKYKLVPRPKPPPQQLVEEVRQIYQEIYYEFNGAMKETPEAIEYTANLYGRPGTITDSRFVYYQERRFVNLLKLGMCFAAARKSQLIELQDYEEAQVLLQATEDTMPDALGEFGMSKIAAAKQLIVEYLANQEVPTTLPMLRALTHRDLTHHELNPALEDLVTAGSIIRDESSGSVLYLGKKRVKQGDRLVELLASQVAE